MVVNNWFVIVDIYVVISGTGWTRFYFILFYFLSVIVLLNIMVAFTIDMYSSVESLYNQKTEDEEKSSSLLKQESDTSDNNSVTYRESAYTRLDDGGEQPYKSMARANSSKDIAEFGGNVNDGNFLLIFVDCSSSDLESSEEEKSAGSSLHKQASNDITQALLKEYKGKTYKLRSPGTIVTLKRQFRLWHEFDVLKPKLYRSEKPLMLAF